MSDDNLFAGEDLNYFLPRGDQHSEAEEKYFSNDPIERWMFKYAKKIGEVYGVDNKCNICRGTHIAYARIKIWTKQKDRKGSPVVYHILVPRAPCIYCDNSDYIAFCDEYQKWWWKAHKKEHYKKYGTKEDQEEQAENGDF